MGRGILSDSLRDVVLSKSQSDLNYGLLGGSLLQIGLWLSYAWRFLAACILPGICGRGQCVITNTSFLIPTFKCVCDPGYENVLNLTAGFCVNECMFLYLSAQVHIHLDQENVAMVLCDNSTNTFNIVNALPMVLGWTSYFPGVAGWVLELLVWACRWTRRELWEFRDYYSWIHTFLIRITWVTRNTSIKPKCNYAQHRYN